MSVDLLPQIAIDFLEAKARLYEEPLPERSRIGLSLALRTLANVTATLEATNPYDFETFDRVNRELAVALTVASQNLDAFRAVQDCAGEG